MNISELYNKYFEKWKPFLINLKNPYLKLDWITWEDPFKDWMQTYIEQKKGQPTSYEEFASNYLNQAMLNVLDEVLFAWRVEAVKSRLFEEKFQSNDFDELVCKCLTTLIYKNKRYNLQEECCLTICHYLILLQEWICFKQTLQQPVVSSLLLNRAVTLIHSALTTSHKLPNELEILLAETENKKGTYFGAYLSDDSDSDEEEKMEADKAQFTYRYHKAHFLRRSIAVYEPITVHNTLYQTNSVDRLPKSPRWIVNRSSLTLNQVEDLHMLNELIKQGMDIKEAEKQVSTSFYVAHYRGVNYATNKWGQTARRNHRDRTTHNEVGKPLYSSSIHKAAGAFPLNSFFKRSAEERAQTASKLQESAQTLEDNLIRARTTRPVVSKIGCNNHYIYSSKANMLQELYSRNYSEFHTAIQSNTFGGTLINDENPFISTGKVPKHALDYAYGTKYYEGSVNNRLRPRWRHDGTAERPYAGKVYVTLHPISLFDKKGPLDVLALSKERELSSALLTEILHERECSFPAWIKGEYVIAEHIAKFPSFKDNYKKIYYYKYGLTEKLYNLFKLTIQNSSPHSKERKNCKVLLSEWLCCYHEVRLIEEAHLAAERLGGVLIYHNQDGSFALEPEAPEIIGTMGGEENEASRAEMKDIDDFRRSLADWLSFQPQNNQSELTSEQVEWLKNNFELCDTGQKVSFFSGSKEKHLKYFNTLITPSSSLINNTASAVENITSILENLHVKNKEAADEDTPGCWYYRP